MIIRDFGFASYLIMLGYEYKIEEKTISFEIDKEEFNLHNKIYKRNYAHKDKILRELLKGLKDS
jgi:hypothetical protein